MRFYTGTAWAFALAIAAGSAPAVHADLKGSLGLFFELGAQDSITALVQTSATALKVEAVDITTTEPKSFEGEVGAKPLAKLLAEARTAGVTVTEWNPATAPAALAVETAPAAEPPKSTRSTSSQRKNRIWYMGYQVPISTYVYGFAIPEALDVESDRVRVALPLLTAPVAFGAHLWFAKSRTFEDAHLIGTRYLSVASLYASYALPFAFMDFDDSSPFRTAAYLSVLTYPLGIWGGYELGNKYIDMPGRVETQSKFATGFGTLGFFSPFLYFEDLDDNIENVVRLGLGQSLVFAAGGHFISEYYRAGENIPGGVTTGILTHSILGAGLGLEIAALSDASTVRPWLGAALAGGTLGFMEGLWYFSKRYDNNERGFYNILGTGAGVAMGAGVLVLVASNDASDYMQKVVPVSLLLGGALIGYAATDLLTSGMEDLPAAGPNHWTERLAFNPIPIPIPEIADRRSIARPGTADRKVTYRYQVPGLTFTF